MVVNPAPVRHRAAGYRMLIEDRTAQFFVVVGQVCTEASVGGLPVRLTLRDGTTYDGSPQPRPADDGRELDHTGFRDAIDFEDGRSVPLSDVIAVSVRHPSTPPS